MLSNSLSRITAAIPSSLKYPLSPLKPLYTRFLSFGQRVIDIPTCAGSLRWHVDELTSQRIILGTYEVYMQRAFQQFVARGSTVYDVGAHAGYHTAICSLLVGASGKVVAFEPHPENLVSLRRQVAVNSFSQVTVCSYALSNLVGVARLNTTRGNSQGFISDLGEYKVMLKTLNQVVSEGNFPPPDVIKIDVEGHEKQVLEGALEVIARHRPVILCDYNDDKTFPELQQIFAPLSYSLDLGPPIIARPD